MTLESEFAASNHQKLNYVVKIGSTFFSKHPVDSGLVIDADKIGMVDNFTVEPVRLDLTRVKTPINNTVIKMIDKDEVFTAFMGNSDNSLMAESIETFLGTITGSFDFSDYIKINDYTVRSITKQDSFYSIKAASQESRMQTPFFDVRGDLDVAINDSATTIIVNTGTDIFETSNQLKIDDEFMSYSGKSFSAGKTTFTGVGRGDLSSTAASHGVGSIVEQVTKIEDNPITILLQLILSGSGTSIYDVLHDGLEISDTLIDVAGFETVRDNFFPADTFRLFLYSEVTGNALKFLEDELLVPNNIRFINTTLGNKFGSMIT